MYACYASLTRDESDDSMGGICEEVGANVYRELGGVSWECNC